MDAPELVNPVDVAEAEPWLRALVMTLLGDPHDDDLVRRVAYWARDWQPERTWGVRAHGRWVGTLATEPRVLTVPGGPGTGNPTNDLDVDALTAVSVAANHRRRGWLSRMLGESLRAAKDRGDAASVLIAAEWPIYGRYGYAPATDAAEFAFYPRLGDRGAVSLGDPTRVRQVERAELAAIAPAVFDAARRLRPGQMDRAGSWWDRRLATNGFELTARGKLNWFVHEGPDGPDGVLAWKATREIELNGPLGIISVEEFATASEVAYRDCWAYLNGIDAAERVDLHERPVDEPVRWLLPDGRALKQQDVCDFLWVRLLDVPRALAARGYAADGHVVLDVLDDAGGLAAGRYELGVVDGRATCAATTAAPDLRLDQRVLASSYLGGHRLRQLAPTGRVEQLTPGALDLVDLMFSTALPPWTQTSF